MVAAWRRVTTGAGLALCGLLLTGCSAEGTFDIVSEDRVVVDLVLRGPDVDCPTSMDGLKLSTTTVTEASDSLVCHVTGETETSTLAPFGINISTAAEYLVLQTNLVTGSNDLPETDIQIRFPGQVVTASAGTVTGNAVRITNLDPLTQGSGMRVVALNRSGPPAWVMAAAVGAGAGVAVTLLVLGLVRLGRGHRPSEAALIEDEPAGTPGVPTAALAEQPGEAWSDSPPSLPATDATPAAPPPCEPPDHTVWAPPDERA